jgi:glycosyltransferase involved in cell wall biosynthesis
MRVLHVISGLRATAGGTVTALIGLARAQRDAACQVSIVSTFIRPEDDAAEPLRRMSIEVHMIGPCTDPMSRSPLIRPTLMKLLPQADIVHIHGLWEQVQHEAARAGRSLGVPYVFSPHGMLDPWSLSQGSLKKRLYLMLRLKRDLQHAAAIHYTTQIERDLAARLRLKPPAIVEPIGLDLTEFRVLPQRGEFRRRHGIAADRQVVLFLARLHPKKGLDLLIPAAANALATQDLLVLAGPDEAGFKRRVEEMIRQHGLQDRVLFTGLLDPRQRLEALADADLFVLPSYQENFGIAVIEALAAGVPVIISDQVNLHRQITAAQVGAVVPANVQALADALRRWLADADLRRVSAGRARAFAQRFDWNDIARRWTDHYQAAMASR